MQPGSTRRPRNRRSGALDQNPRLDLPALKIVAAAANKFVFRPKRRRNEYDEYFGAGQLAATELLKANPKAPESHVRTAVKQAIVEHWQRSNHIPIPPTTRRRWVKKGIEPQDFQRQSLNYVFDRFGDFRQSVLKENPHWENSEQMVLAGARTDIEWMEATEPFRRLVELCVDVVDRRVLEARWNNGQGLNDYTMLHVDEVAKRAGLRPKEVRRRLTELQRRYYAFTGRRLKPGPMPSGTRL